MDAPLEQKQLSGESGDQYRLLVEHSSDHIFMLGLDGTFVQSNDRTYHLNDGRGKDLLGRNAGQVFGDGAREDYEMYFRQVLDTGRPVSFEYSVEKNGRIYYHFDTLYPVFHNGTLWAVGGISRDITARKKAEDERALHTAAVEHTHDGICIIDDLGNYEYVNSAYAAFTGYSPEELIGSQTAMLNSERHNPENNERMIETIRSGSVFKGVLAYRTKDGEEIDVESTISPVTNENGEVVKYIGVIRDITARLQLEEQLRQSQKMEAIGTLAGGIAHDFNNILGAIVGFSEMSFDDLSEGHPVRHNLEQILRSSMRARDLVKQILAFSRKSGQELKQVRLQQLLKEVVKLLRSTIPSTIDIQYRFPDSVGSVVADATQIHQVVMNLATNAAYAMRSTGGVLEIVLDETELRRKKNIHGLTVSRGRYVTLSVSDTGTGISRQDMDRIFDPFFTTKDPGQGTGMGLAVVQGIVANHSGAIEVKSKEGKGSLFRVLLPNAGDGADTEKDVGGTKKPLPKGTESILIVDDEDILISVAHKILSSLGYRVTSFTRSTDALSEFKRNPEKYDLVITDQTMPELTGYELASEIMTLRPSVPVILCTGYSESVDGDSAAKAGIKAFIMKPLDRRNIAETIRGVLPQPT